MRIKSLLLMAALAVASTGAAPSFESHWQDGKAELDGYRYTVTRYGQKRTGEAVMIFVTEPFSASKRVKVDDPKKNPRDTFEALKLNLVRDIQTGIYDYNTMVSLFVRSSDFSPVKITFSSAEWCGHVFEEMLYERHHIADRYSSYFEDESDLQRVTRKEDGITEDELYIRLRGLRGHWLQAGERRVVHMLPSTFYRRLTHRPLRWTKAKIHRSPDTKSVTVPAGTFATSLYTVRVEDGREGRFWIEQDYPHRIVRWDWKSTRKRSRRGGDPSEGLDSGVLTGSTRVPYWKLQGLGDEKYRKQLGLTAR